MIRRILAASLLLSVATPALAQEASPPATAPAPRTAPKLIVTISVDQLSADVFAEYRQYFTGGFTRLLTGAVFPSGYQSHAATETCPGHSTIMTGARPARNGIIANDWIDQNAPREDKTVYCAEDESVAGSSSDKYTVSPLHLKVPTLGERMKTATPATRTVSVAGKDRAAVMMGGHKMDEIWWWEQGAKAFVSYAGKAAPAAVTKANDAAQDSIAQGGAAMALPAFCAAKDVAEPIGAGKTVGAGRLERPAGNAGAYRASPFFDRQIFDLAADLVDDMKLGRGSAVDVLTVGASASDYVGHAYGPGGLEMCLQLDGLDKALGDFLDRLDRSGVDHVVALTADHGGHDLPERHRDHAITEARRATLALAAKNVGATIQQKLKLDVAPLLGGIVGDMYINKAITGQQRDAVLAEAVAAYKAQDDVYAVYTAAEIMAAPDPSGPPESWSLPTRLKASYMAGRSGDFLVILDPRVTPIPDPTKGYVSTHGSIWDYDRRVPILFWRKGLAGFEQPSSVETVDIAPTLAGVVGFALPSGEIDGRCLDIDGTAESSCPAR